MHRAGARFLYGTFSGRGRGQSAGPGKCKRRTDLPANVRNTAVKCGKRVRTVRMKTFALANVFVRTVPTCPYMFLLMSPDFRTFGRECSTESTDYRGSGRHRGRGKDRERRSTVRCYIFQKIERLCLTHDKQNL